MRRDAAPPGTLTARVIALRQEYGWGGDKLAWLLEQEGCIISGRTIDRIIQREGLTRQNVAHPPALHRFERAAPNELWQMDAKGAYPLTAGRCHPLSVLDDHTRYAVGLFALPALGAAPVRAALIDFSSDCGFGRQGCNREIAFYKATAVAQGCNIVRRELGLASNDVPAADPQLQIDIVRASS